MFKQAVYIAILSFLLLLIFKRHRSIARDTFDEEYDFIVVGGGTSGSAVAGRLSEQDTKVLVLEAGDEDYFDPLTSVPLLGQLSPGTSRDWQYVIEPQKDACKNMLNNQIRWPRGKILGGTSSLNYMIFARGCKEDYQSWKSSGAEGWGYDDVLPYFKKSENYQNIPDLQDSPYHGNGGKISVRRTYTVPASEVFMKAGEELGFKINQDYNGATMEGFSHFQQSVKDGYRQNSATAYLRPVAYSRQEFLHIVVKTKVIRVLFDESKSAIGVEVERAGSRSIIRARKEVILSAGSIGNPHILMLSGIGPQDHLKENKIPVVSDLPGVGSNLADHIMVPSYFYSPVMSKEVINLKTVLRSTMDYLLHGWGPLSASITDSVATIKHKNSTLPQFQLYFGGLEVDESAFKNLYSIAGNLKPENYEDAYREATSNRDGVMFSFFIVTLLSHPKSSGLVRLNSSDPMSSPIINPNYLNHPDDMKHIIEGLKLVNKISNTDIFQKKNITKVMFYKECSSLEGNAKYECIVRHETFTGFHPCCTASMGKNKMSVVDPELRVYGVKNLRVADASVMPHIVTGPLQATCYMIAEKLAEMIKTRWKL